MSRHENPHPRQRYHSVPIMDQVEDIENYCPGGFAPLSIGDVIGGGKYTIVYKLGFGGIAMVWLCYDEEERKWCAIKVNADSNSTDDCGDLEAIRLMKDNGLTVEKLGENHILMSFDTFWEYSPNGRHLCTVMPVVGPRAHDWRTEDMGRDADRINKMCYQLTQGLSFLHENGLVHGDFRPQNILMKLKPNSLDLLSKDDMWNLLGEPATAEIRTLSDKRSRHAPKEVVSSALWEKFSPVITDDIAIVDFGEAYLPHNPPAHFGIPRKYACPEIFFKARTSGLASDIWSLGLTILELRLDDYGSDLPSDIIRFLERFVGPLPRKYRSIAEALLKGEGLKKAEGPGPEPSENCPLMGPVDLPLGEKEELESENTEFRDRLEVKIASGQKCYGEAFVSGDRTGRERKRALVRYRLPEEEVRLLGDLLHQILRYDPRERISAREAFGHPWFRKSRGETETKDRPATPDMDNALLWFMPNTATATSWATIAKLLLLFIFCLVLSIGYSSLTASSSLDRCTITLIYIA
ncbi:kinase-like protein [Poronia punctata]|nr:kinase-like protein [Poronia punctata]